MPDEIRKSDEGTAVLQRTHGRIEAEDVLAFCVRGPSEQDIE